MDVMWSELLVDQRRDRIAGRAGVNKAANLYGRELGQVTGPMPGEEEGGREYW